jgi:RHS repeat-associated protein
MSAGDRLRALDRKVLGEPKRVSERVRPIVSADKFLGKTLDATGLNQVGARNYDSAAGAFSSPDPLTGASGIASLNPYNYGNADPVQFTDPSGLKSVYASEEAWDDIGDYDGDGQAGGVPGANVDTTGRKQVTPTPRAGPIATPGGSRGAKPPVAAELAFPKPIPAPPNAYCPPDDPTCHGSIDGLKAAGIGIGATDGALEAGERLTQSGSQSGLARGLNAAKHALGKGARALPAVGMTVAFVEHKRDGDGFFRSGMAAAGSGVGAAALERPALATCTFMGPWCIPLVVGGGIVGADLGETGGEIIADEIGYEW